MSDDLLSPYQAVEALSAQMLQAAERADWPAFNQVHNACTRQVQTLRENQADRVGAGTWSRLQAAQKHAILLRILRNDAQIRRLRAGVLPEPVVSPPAAPGFSAYRLQASRGLLH